MIIRRPANRKEEEVTFRQTRGEVEDARGIDNDKREGLEVKRLKLLGNRHVGFILALFFLPTYSKVNNIQSNNKMKSNMNISSTKKWRRKTWRRRRRKRKK